jgi:hypothetical protein
MAVVVADVLAEEKDMAVVVADVLAEDINFTLPTDLVNTETYDLVL